jgi:hypothetical protein
VTLENNTGYTPQESTGRSRKYDRKKRIKTVAELDGRTLAARRIATLVRMWTAALGNNLTSEQQIAVDRAATCVALAEDARCRRLSGDKSISLSDTVRLDNVASRAVNALNLPPNGKREPEPAGGFKLRPLE